LGRSYHYGGRHVKLPYICSSLINLNAYTHVRNSEVFEQDQWTIAMLLAWIDSDGKVLQKMTIEEITIVGGKCSRGFYVLLLTTT
jgi:hypothetical protein